MPPATYARNGAVRFDRARHDDSVRIRTRNPRDVTHQTFTVRIAHDRTLDALTLCATCGAVICSGIAGGIEVAGGIALIAARVMPPRRGPAFDALRFGTDDAWAVVGEHCGVTPIDPPVVHVSHRAIVVLEVRTLGTSEFLVFTASATVPDELRRLRALLRSRRLAR